MRKVILVMVFALASFSISGVNTLNPEADNGCEKYAMDLAIEEYEAYGDTDFDTFEKNHEYYLELCEEADGAISDLIFL